MASQVASQCDEDVKTHLEAGIETTRAGPGTLAGFSFRSTLGREGEKKKNEVRHFPALRQGASPTPTLT